MLCRAGSVQEFNEKKGKEMLYKFLRGSVQCLKIPEIHLEGNKWKDCLLMKM